MNARELIESGDEQGIDDAFFDEQCPEFFAVDWREEDEQIVSMCEAIIKSGKLQAAWRSDKLFIRYGDTEQHVPLTDSEGDRHVTICALDDLMAPDYEIRYLVASHGSDTLGFCVLPKCEWDELDERFRATVEANFIDPRTLPNLVTELTDDLLPPPARARFERMIDRNTR